MDLGAFYIQQSKKMTTAILILRQKYGKTVNLTKTYRADITVHEKKHYDEVNAELETYISISE